MAQSGVFTLLLVDDDPLIHQSFRLCLPPHWKPISATRSDEVPFERSFHAAFVDMHLEPHQPLGLNVLQRLSQEHPETELIAMSGDLRRDLMEAALKAGAQRFLAKPLQSEELLLILSKIEALFDLRQGLTRTQPGPQWIGDGPASQKVLQSLAAFRGEPGPILIEGESGTGKEVAARLLHHQEENGRPFIPVNVAALPENLFEAELFGHVKGAFTGADRDRAGLCESAAGGDLFLDEIEALPLALQVKLLRFLESGEIRRVGARESNRIHCRVIAAGNQPLEELVRQGKFREDLYFRLSGKRLNLPPLRERKEDLRSLAEFFLRNERPRRNKSFSEDGFSALAAYHWPGNVRELKRVCEQLSLTSPLPLIREQEVEALSPRTSPRAASAIPQMDLGRGLAALLSDYEREIIRRALALENDIEKTGQLLGISRSSLYKKIKDHGLEPQE
ncbi:MAG TPA: sigma-54 dependent transcriptional regulator [Pseudobdellovibrionaceae bacterium]|nr:sigma-54 dependent transcriptional regulator [Pseudobdellovibrionaceae bacterium]